MRRIAKLMYHFYEAVTVDPVAAGVSSIAGILEVLFGLVAVAKVCKPSLIFVHCNTSSIAASSRVSTTCDQAARDVVILNMP